MHEFLSYERFCDHGCVFEAKVGGGDGIGKDEVLLGCCFLSFSVVIEIEIQIEHSFSFAVFFESEYVESYV